MIKNIVFDFGQVMVRFEPSYMVGKYVNNAQDAKLLEEVVFDRLYWDRLDEGTITDEALIEDCKRRLPKELWAKAEEIYYNWIYNIPEIDGMRSLVTDLKSRFGVRLLLLSNISKYFAAHREEIPCLAEFEGCVFSAEVGRVKPNSDIFEYLCQTYGILPKETVFVDDNAANIAGAENYGIHGYLFDGDVARLREYFENVLEEKRS